jgi:phosphatidylglycerophosphate synthase
LGKWKTVTQMLAVGAFVFPPTAGARSLQLALVWAAVALTLVSGLDLWWRGRSGPAGGAR